MSAVLGSIAYLACLIGLIACGETRHAPGEACLRGDDCLSGFCTDRICVAAPPLGKPLSGGTDDGGDDGGASSTDGASADARGD